MLLLFSVVHLTWGRSMGIITVEKMSQSGMPYTLLMYPPEIQKEIVSFFAGSGSCQESEKG